MNLVGPSPFSPQPFPSKLLERHRACTAVSCARSGRAAHAVRRDPSPRVPPLHQSSQLHVWPSTCGKECSSRLPHLFATHILPTAGTPPGLYNRTLPGPLMLFATTRHPGYLPLSASLLNWPVKASGKGMLFPSPPPPRTRSLLTTLSLPTAGTPPGLYSSKRARGRQVLLPSPLPLTTSLPSNRGNASPRPLYMYHTSPAPFNRGNATQRARAPNAAAGILVPSPPPLTPRSPSQPACTDPLTPTAAGTHAARLCPLRVLFSRVPNAEGVAV